MIKKKEDTFSLGFAMFEFVGGTWFLFFPLFSHSININTFMLATIIVTGCIKFFISAIFLNFYIKSIR